MHTGALIPAYIRKHEGCSALDIVTFGFLEDAYFREVGTELSRRSRVRYASFGFRGTNTSGIDPDSLLDLGWWFNSRTCQKSHNPFWISPAHRQTLDEALKRSHPLLMGPFRRQQISTFLRLADDLVHQILNKCQHVGFVWNTTPHFAWDLAIYFAARRRDVTCIFSQRTALPGMVLLRKSIYYPEFAVFEKSRCQSEIEMALSMPDGDFSAWVASGPMRKVSMTDRSSKGPILLYQYIYRRLREGRKAYAKARQSYFGLNPFAAVILLCARAVSFMLGNGVLRMASARVPGSNDYAVYYLQVRPERTLCPEAAGNWNQWENIKRLRAMIPAGCHLYVKEHPDQLGDGPFAIRKVRFPEFLLYLRVLLLKGVTLLHRDDNPTRTLANATVVSTVTGSVAWQALEFNSRIVVFAPSWVTLHGRIEIWNEQLSPTASGRERPMRVNDPTPTTFRQKQLIRKLELSLVPGFHHESAADAASVLTFASAHGHALFDALNDEI